jgi:hypothetical protein
MTPYARENLIVIDVRPDGVIFSRCLRLVKGIITQDDLFFFPSLIVI